MRMLITLFSILFILGTHSVVHALTTETTCDEKTDKTSCNATAGCYWNNADCTAKKYTLTYKCAKNDEQAIFTQQYADIKQPCTGTDNTTINYIYYEKNFNIPTFLASESGVERNSGIAPSSQECLTDLQYYAPKTKIECKKTGYKLIGWQTPEGKAVLNIHGTNDEISEILNSYKEYEIIEAKTDSEIKYKWDKDINLYPVWAAEKITCDGGQYFSAESAKCTDCPAGFYCPGVSDGTIDAENPKDIGRYPCPFGSTSDGSTSDTKSDAITDCYLKPAVETKEHCGAGASSDAITDCYSGTKFCGASTGDCIYMPASAEPAYHTGTTETSDE